MLKLVVFDFDGVFTNGKVSFNNHDIIKEYNVKDGLAMSKLNKNKFYIGVISGWKSNQSQLSILNHLNIKRFSLGTKDKLSILKKWCIELNINLENVAYMGDDLNDLEVMKEVKFIGCPNDAVNEVKSISHFISRKNGGDGCIREFVDYIIKNNNIKFNNKNGKMSAIIAVRKGSVRCPNKNIKPFGDTNLLTLKIKILKNVKNLDEIIVTTDCEISKKIANIMGVTVLDRPEYYCSDKCSGSEMQEFIANQCKNEHILYSPVTSPFIESKFFEEMIEKYRNLEHNDCLILKSDIKEFIWNKERPLNYEVDKFPRSQDLTKDIFYINFGCCIISKKKMVEKKYMIGNFPLFINNKISHSSIDIDEQVDFDLATLIYNKIFRNNKNIKFIDVTLRDGGFVNNWNSSYDDIIKYYNLMNNLDYEYFEIGYLINENIREKNSGICRNIPFDLFKNFPKKKCKISVMIDFWKYNI